jgi:hypothetical protein
MQPAKRRSCGYRKERNRLGVRFGFLQLLFARKVRRIEATTSAGERRLVQRSFRDRISKMSQEAPQR